MVNRPSTPESPLGGPFVENTETRESASIFGESSFCINVPCNIDYDLIQSVQIGFCLSHECISFKRIVNDDSIRNIELFSEHNAVAMCKLFRYTPEILPRFNSIAIGTSRSASETIRNCCFLLQRSSPCELQWSLIASHKVEVIPTRVEAFESLVA